MYRFEIIYKLLLELCPDLPSLKPGDVRRYQAGSAFMPLVLERLGEDRYSLTHYYKMNGDMVPDPDMEIRVDHKNRVAEAINYTDLYGFCMVYPEKDKVNLYEKRRQNGFLAQWLRNIKNQGFERVDSVTYPDHTPGVI